MGTLGEAILNAMRDQGWLIAFEEGEVRLWSWNGYHHATPIELWESGNEQRLRVVLLVIQLKGGFRWPWPPDHVDGIGGEVPRSGW
ncbi:hypothetical protein [Prauserella endophytica]|uniref:Uncharacterized protein n=1 Tax=Prauserella endophytica TaxID=1592324 RepID=A0ABY2RS42_9PSEU|nr:hypothetical protein [Prauserella endophytica]TKG57948.1 hypothetical protein FCN18_38540 [Prauserella endophytica]